MLVAANDLGIHTDAGCKILMAAKTALLAHLEREDKHLYPILLKAAEDDPILRDALDFFYENIEGVARTALTFFDKYETGAEGADLATDLAELVSVLMQRIRKEESVTYKMFDQLDIWQDGAGG